MTLFLDNIQMTGLDQVFYVDLNQTDPGSGVNVQTTRSSVTLQPIGKPCMINFVKLRINGFTIVIHIQFHDNLALQR